MANLTPVFSLDSVEETLPWVPSRLWRQHHANSKDLAGIHSWQGKMLHGHGKRAAQEIFLPQQSWATQFLSQVSVLSFLKFSCYCLLFPLRLFGLQGNVCHVLCTCTMAGKAILFRAALPAVNALIPWFTLPLLSVYSVAHMQWTHLISCGCVFMLTHSEMSLSGHNGSSFCRWMNTLQSCIISFFHWTNAIQRGLYFQSENSYVSPFSSLFTYLWRLLKGKYFSLTASSGGVIKSFRNGRKRLLERHRPAEESPKERIKNDQMSRNMWFTGKSDINWDCLF